jgi:hypothetical protein
MEDNDESGGEAVKCRKRLVPAEALRLSELGRRVLEEEMRIVAGTIESTISCAVASNKYLYVRSKERGATEFPRCWKNGKDRLHH